MKTPFRFALAFAVSVATTAVSSSPPDSPQADPAQHWETRKHVITFAVGPVDDEDFAELVGASGQ